MKPFIKWVGGKQKVCTQLEAFLPATFQDYYEPFLGSGALFFHLERATGTAYLGDANYDLICLYKEVQTNPQRLKEGCERFEAIAQADPKKFHNTLAYMDRKENWANVPAPFRAARALYLNRTSYGGMWRVNKKGQFNTPYVKNKNKIFSDNTWRCSTLLQNAKIHCMTYDKLLVSASPRDFIYLDPPYYPLSDTSNFQSYAVQETELHETLANYCLKLDKRGIKFLMSNSDCPTTRWLYKPFNTRTIEVSRVINSNTTKRGKISELIITNY